MDSNKWSLHNAALHGDIGTFRVFLADGVDVDKRGFIGRTPLHWAAVAQHFDLVRFLVDQGADPQATDLYGETPLHLAIYKGDFRIFEFLVSLGVDTTFTNLEGMTMLHLIVQAGHDKTWMKPLFEITDPAVLCSMKDNCGNTPLHLTPLARTVDSVKSLVEYGFDPSTSGVRKTWVCLLVFSIENDNGDTPYKTAAKRSRTAIVQYLDSFESLPLIDLGAMKLRPELNDFQRFLARRIYYMVLTNLPLEHDTALRVMAFLSPADVMK